MTDDDFDKEIDNEFAEEFDFVEDDTAKPMSASSSTKTASSSNKPSGSGSKLTTFIVILVIVGGGYFGYKFMTGGSETASDAAPVPAPTDMPVPTTTDPNMQPAAAPTAPTDGMVDFSNTPSSATSMPAAQDDQLANALPPQAKSFEQMQKDLQGVKPVKTAIPDEINATLDSISEEMTLNVNQIKNLESTITSLASSVDQLNKSVSAMDNRVLGLTETVDGLVQDLSNVKRIIADEDIDLTSSNKVKYSNKNQTQALSGNTPEFSVHAIIPGRAWLKSSSGQILTVTEGDRVGDYGTVAVIDAANGIVRTSSGITFR